MLLPARQHKESIVRRTRAVQKIDSPSQHASALNANRPSVGSLPDWRPPTATGLHTLSHYQKSWIRVHTVIEHSYAAHRESRVPAKWRFYGGEHIALRSGFSNDRTQAEASIFLALLTTCTFCLALLAGQNRWLADWLAGWLASACVLY